MALQAAVVDCQPHIGQRVGVAIGPHLQLRKAGVLGVYLSIMVGV